MPQKDRDNLINSGKIFITEFWSNKYQ